MESNGATLYVASNKEVPLTVISHLYDVRVQLKKLEAVIQNSEKSPDPNNPPLQANAELELQTIIYAHSYYKIRRRCLKRAPAILGQYHAIMKSIYLTDISKKMLIFLMALTDCCEGFEIIWRSPKHPRFALPSMP